MTKKQPPERTIRRRKDARPGEIMDAALIEFSMHGFAGAKLDQVAERAEVSKGTIYHYYKDKQSLFEALVNDRLTYPLLDELPEGLANNLTTAALLKLAMTLAYQQGRSSESLALVKPLLMEPDCLTGFSTHPMSTIVTTAGKMLGLIIEKGIADGEILASARDLHPAEFLVPVFAAIVLYDQLNGIADFDMDQYVSKQVDYMIERISV